MFKLKKDPREEKLAKLISDGKELVAKIEALQKNADRFCQSLKEALAVLEEK